MDFEEKKETFFAHLYELSKEKNGICEFQCPICGGYAFGYYVFAVDSVVGSCPTCCISGRWTKPKETES